MQRHRPERAAHPQRVERWSPRGFRRHAHLQSTRDVDARRAQRSRPVVPRLGAHRGRRRLHGWHTGPPRRPRSQGARHRQGERRGGRGEERGRRGVSWPLHHLPGFGRRVAAVLPRPHLWLPAAASRGGVGRYGVPRVGVRRELAATGPPRALRSLRVARGQARVERPAPAGRRRRRLPPRLRASRAAWGVGLFPRDRRRRGRRRGVLVSRAHRRPLPVGLLPRAVVHRGPGRRSARGGAVSRGAPKLQRLRVPGAAGDATRLQHGRGAGGPQAPGGRLGHQPAAGQLSTGRAYVAFARNYASAFHDAFVLRYPEDAEVLRIHAFRRLEAARPALEFGLRAEAREHLRVAARWLDWPSVRILWALSRLAPSDAAASVLYRVYARLADRVPALR